MKVYLTDEFIAEVKNLLRNKAYSDCEEAIILEIFVKSSQEIRVGSKRLGGSPNDSPFLRKRIKPVGKGKSSGYRLYFWILIQENDIYLLYIHPKTGRRGGGNITSQKQRELVGTFKEVRDTDLCGEVKLNETSDKIIYLVNKAEVFP